MHTHLTRSLFHIKSISNAKLILPRHLCVCVCVCMQSIFISLLTTSTIAFVCWMEPKSIAMMTKHANKHKHAYRILYICQVRNPCQISFPPRPWHNNNRPHSLCWLLPSERIPPISTRFSSLSSKFVPIGIYSMRWSPNVDFLSLCICITCVDPERSQAVSRLPHTLMCVHVWVCVCVKGN